jgi:YebC/PmpR family DNA-binding regulatory protein
VSGHSKWSTIKHKKAALDKKRSKSWSKLAKAITISAKMGGGNIDDNPRLRLAIEKAKADNMPKDTIEKAVLKGTGELDGESYEEVLYEGYGAGGVAIMCLATTDNRNRTGGEIKKIFEKAGGNLGSPNCVAFQFTQKGVIVLDADAVDEDRLMEIAMEAGADDVSSSKTAHEVICSPESFDDVRKAIESENLPVQSADLAMLADNTIELDLKTARKVLRLVESLEDQDDADAVYSNADIPDDVVAELANG